MRSLSFAFVGLLGVTSAAAASFSSANVKDMFDSCMEYLDEKYDSDFHYMYNLETENAMRHTTVESPWYALGLLMRNQGNDVDEAEKIIGKVIDGQFTDKSKQWYGSYTRSPSQPVVGSRVYPAKIYGSWDPNYRGFIGTTLAMMLEEHSDVLSDAIQERMLESLHRAVIGDTYRVGGVDGDNLYPGYSNPVGNPYPLGFGSISNDSFTGHNEGIHRGVAGPPNQGPQPDQGGRDRCQRDYRAL